MRATLTTSFTIVLLAGSVQAAEIGPARDNLIVHEWGTFTSVAGANGAPLGWVPLASTPDLPCFVNRLTPQQIKMSLATVRMETPVLYFYSHNDMTASVHVDFPQGWITEWYPQASNVTPHKVGEANFDFRNGGIAWDGLRLSADEGGFPTSKGASRYYAARNADSAALTIAGQHEKMIFYRGIGNFGIPLTARYEGDVLNIRANGPDTVPMALLFENHDGQIGYRFVHGAASVAAPEMTGKLEDLRQALTDALVENGLYRKEAVAMLETWKDSWFEQGSRLIYVVPRGMVDRVLPLNVTPAPQATARVFVGRIELLSPSVRGTIDKAIAVGDAATLAKYGRFLDPFLHLMNGVTSNTASINATLNQARRTIYAQVNSGCVE